MSGRVLDFRSPDYAERQLPNDVEAELLVLGAVLYDNDAADRCEHLRAEHFYEPGHGRAWGIITALIAKGSRADATTVGAQMESDPVFQELGGWQWLADLIDHAPATSVVRDYADIVVDRAIRRELLTFTGELTTAAKTIDPERPASAVLEQAERSLFGIAEAKTDQGGFVSFSSALDKALQSAGEAYMRDGALVGLSTGLTDLDAKLGGLHPSDLLILAGATSMGKTSLATNIAFSVARSYVPGPVVDGVKTAERGGVVAFYSLEMSEEQLAQRIVADVAGISSDRIRKGQIDASEFGRLRDAADELREVPLHIDATGAISIARLSQRARRLKRRKGLDLIVVDYLQLVTTDMGGRNSNRVQEVAAITGGLKALAKDLNVPVIALCQLSRKVSEREDKKPQLSDLRESGSIEQDADAVLFVHREEYYLGRTEPRAGTPEHMNWTEEMSKVQGLAEVIIGKQRHGPIGTVRLHFNADTTRFSNLAREGRYDQNAGRLPYGDQ
jgi:replicative DNA helicase